MIRGAIVCAVIAGVVQGCSSTETGNPPRTSTGISIDALSAMVISPFPPDGGSPAPGPTRLSGAPGALEPDITSMRVVVWESTAPALIADREGDGSFSVVVPRPNDGEIRLQAAGAADRRPPVDIQFSGSSIVPLPHPIGDCLDVPLEATLASRTPPSDAAIVIRNDCGMDVSFAPPASRLGQLALDANPIVVGAGEQTTLVVSFGARATMDEDLLILSATAPTPDRRAVTVRVEEP